jgi:hypothetical protein
LGGATIRKTIITSVYIEKKTILRNQQANFNQSSNHPCVKGIKNFTNEGPGPFQRADNHKNAKMGWIIQKSSQEPLS